ncbi:MULTISPECIES: GntR family transcriptional regulator [Glutamicibacter]|jgi:DNA-binding transcriptional regulator YhcF (GntR family)|uniref:GntR family transcriptional regulator n=2 Tax=Glutamicibacter arilaitensis TaxID=256701 RepID=A0A2N7S3H5_9MICC|nr:MULTISPECIES: GntR family transcriptional regulator [Glutamicibacter]PMQ20702.1 GntR family transcriptional regulator [Glutamicibacter arilaitensis]TFH56942.1 GntR family transcriptional regulator [Glutamicibacter arilaitensis]CBT76130.1 putative transcriptional regulator [Glutamicibacter arilaitensis Re117]HCH47619.1 GntR family transcriptional regulator [Glutamicibacter sp.]HCJ54240.1 GntR family transcriptional regulator [Glutamicibacter sp.]
MTELAFIKIEPTSGIAPYQQVREQILAAIAKGKLAPGTKLPSVRALAGNLNLAVNTVAKVYKELELQGAVVTRGRHGTIVQAAENRAEQEVSDAAADLARIAQTWSVDEATAVKYLRAAFSSLPR